jgi:hypothetical protein
MLPPLQAGVWRPKGNLGPGSEAGTFLKRPGSGSEHSGPVSAPSKLSRPGYVRAHAAVHTTVQLPLCHDSSDRVLRVVPVRRITSLGFHSIKRLLEWRVPV